MLYEISYIANIEIDYFIYKYVDVKIPIKSEKVIRNLIWHGWSILQ